MKFDRSDLNDNRIKDFSDVWTKTVDQWPHCAGVFVFVDEAEDVKYVGWAPLGGLRTHATDAFKAGKNRGATKFGWAECFSDHKARSIAQEFIAKYQPPNN